MSIFVLTEFLFSLASDYGVLFQFMGQEPTDAFSRRMDEMNIAENVNDLQIMPGRYEHIESDEKWQLWSVDLSHDCKLYFIPTESILNLVSVFSYRLVSSSLNCLLIVGIKTKTALIGHNTLTAVNLEHEKREPEYETPITGYIFKRKVG